MTPMPRSCRRLVFAFAALALLTGGAAAGEKHHALSLVGTPKYGPDFKHFDHVNPTAPKGGVVRLSEIGTFDTMNVISYKGNMAEGLGLLYEQLMVSSQDEPSSEYPQLAEWVSYPDDFSSVTFKIREQARWHDGKPVTPEDVIFSFEAFKAHHSLYSFYYKNVVKAEKTSDHLVTFTFDEKNNRELPQIVGQLNIVPKHFYDGHPGRDPSKTWLETPLGSGPYRIKSFEAGRNIVYERVPDYWGAKLPVNVGQNNFDEIRYEYFQDRIPAFEAFKAGRIDYFLENSAKQWATAYDFPALKAGKVIKRGDVRLQNPEPMQGFVLNLRREQFKDARVRHAFNLIFNFEWMNKNVFYGQYTRTTSYFENTEMAARGLPQGKELEILEAVRAEVPPEVFTTEFKNPVNDERSLVDRGNLRKATDLLQQAGWEIKNGVLVNAKTGAPMEFEFLLISPAMERVISPYIQMLEKIGVKARIRMLVDAAQYKRRIDTYDFDAIVGVFAQSESPGNEQRDYWASSAADKHGTRNYIGIKNPAVDKLIERIIFAKDREELVAACRALDRVLLWNHYLVPQFFTPFERFAYWDRYSAPAKLPSRSIGFPTVWWYDAAKAEKLGTN